MRLANPRHSVCDRTGPHHQYRADFRRLRVLDPRYPPAPVSQRGVVDDGFDGPAYACEQQRVRNLVDQLYAEFSKPGCQERPADPTVEFNRVIDEMDLQPTASDQIDFMTMQRRLRHFSKPKACNMVTHIMSLYLATWRGAAGQPRETRPSRLRFDERQHVIERQPFGCKNRDHEGRCRPYDRARLLTEGFAHGCYIHIVNFLDPRTGVGARLPNTTTIGGGRRVAFLVPTVGRRIVHRGDWMVGITSPIHPRP